MNAQEIAETAAGLVSGKRHEQHGDKVVNHENISKLWNAYLQIREDVAAPLGPLDVVLMMALLKIARTQLGETNIDDFVDAVGYISIAGEIASG